MTLDNTLEQFTEAVQLVKDNIKDFINNLSGEELTDLKKMIDEELEEREWDAERTIEAQMEEEYYEGKK